MSDTKTIVTNHYDTGRMLERIKAGLRAAGIDPDAPSPDDLKAVDEFHTGGVEATEALLAPLGIGPAHRVADLGSGIGGTARFIASRYGASVTGYDLTEAFVETARALSAMAGIERLTAFETASVLDLPAADNSFDLATMFHVGMNIEDKEGIFREAARILVPGGRFALFDLMIRDGGAHDFPVPWASEPVSSHLSPPEAYRAAAEAAGMRLAAERDRHGYAVGFFDRVMAAQAEAGGPPHIGLHLIMGETARERYGNFVRAVKAGTIGPWEMVFEVPA